MKPVDDNITETFNDTFHDYAHYYWHFTGYKGVMVIQSNGHVSIKTQREIIPYTAELRKDFITNTRIQVKEIYRTRLRTPMKDKLL